MAVKTVRFPLEMKDGVQVRTIPELKENFDVEKVIGYFLDGRLKKWLDSRWYEDESEAISNLDEKDPMLVQHLCNIFEVECVAEEINPEMIAEKNARIIKLKQYTDEEEILKNIDAVAFNQEELAELYENNIKKIYLCEGEFKIPKSKKNLEYIILNAKEVEGLEKKEFEETNLETIETNEEQKKKEFIKKILPEIHKPLYSNMKYCPSIFKDIKYSGVCNGYGSESSLTDILLRDIRIIRTQKSFDLDIKDYEMVAVMNNQLTERKMEITEEEIASFYYEFATQYTYIIKNAKIEVNPKEPENMLSEIECRIKETSLNEFMQNAKYNIPFAKYQVESLRPLEIRRDSRFDKVIYSMKHSTSKNNLIATYVKYFELCIQSQFYISDAIAIAAVISNSDVNKKYNITEEDIIKLFYIVEKKIDNLSKSLIKKTIAKE